MKKIMTILLFLLTAGFVAADNGAIWTTASTCGDVQQDMNNYVIGDRIYIDGANFDAGNYTWSITGKPGGGSSDPNIVVASGIKTIDGTFCFEAYTVNADDNGEYGVDFGNKKDNYRVKDVTIPEFGVIAGVSALVGALGIFMYRRK